MNGIVGIVLLLSASHVNSFKFVPGRTSYHILPSHKVCDNNRIVCVKTQLSAVVKDIIEEDNLNEQFKEWEAEEEETQRRELEDTVREARAAGTEDELPDYMMRCADSHSHSSKSVMKRCLIL